MASKNVNENANANVTPAAPELTPTQVFERDAAQRVNALLKELERLEKLGRSKKGKYTPAHAEKIFAVLDAAIEKAAAAFNPEAESANKFSF